MKGRKKTGKLLVNFVSMEKYIPEELIEYILPFNWDVRRVWELEAKVEEFR
jgi:hypothetical protein